MDLLSAKPAMGCGAGKATQYKSTEDADVEPLPLSHSWDSATISKTSLQAKAGQAEPVRVAQGLPLQIKEGPNQFQF